MADLEAERSRLLRLVDEAHDELHRSDVHLSAAVAKAARIARLRGDLENLYWLEMEMHPIGEQSPRAQIEVVLAQKYGEDWDTFRVTAAEQYFKRRELDRRERDEEGLICAMSVGQIGAQLEWLAGVVAHLKTEQGLNADDALTEGRRLEKERVEAQMTARDLAFVREKIRAHVATFLSTTETQLLVGEAASDIFEENRRYVDRELRAISTKALTQLSAAYRRQSEEDSEAGSQALTSCRRVLKSLADSLYPASDQMVEGRDGKTRKMSDDKFISRLLQFASDRLSKSASGSLIEARLGYFAVRLEALNKLSSKGVHADVSEFEVNQCVIETYLLVGDLLHLRGIST
jgi:hypothetical protein